MFIFEIVTISKVVSGWTYPEEEMVAYRSFKPFFPLLQPLQVGIPSCFDRPMFGHFSSPSFLVTTFSHCCMILDRKRQCSCGQSGQSIMSALKIPQGKNIIALCLDPKLVAHSQMISQVLRHVGCSRRTDSALGPGQGDRHTCYCPQDNQHGLFLNNLPQLMTTSQITQVV